jgi:hypothetical protein
MVSPPQVVGNSIIVFYADAGAVNFATVVLTCGRTNFLNATSASTVVQKANGGQTYVLQFHTSAACFPVPPPPVSPPPVSPPPVSPSASSGTPTSAPSAPSFTPGDVAGIVVGVVVGLLVVATLILNVRHQAGHAVWTGAFWTIVPRLCCTVQSREDRTPLMADGSSAIQGDKLSEA